MLEYEYKESIKEMIESYVISESEELKMKAELDHVYSQAAKADEYEAKAKILDRVKEFSEEPPFLLANNENADYERYAYDQILKLINKYESGEPNAKK